jgi:molybdate transport system regulatory protein
LFAAGRGIRFPRPFLLRLNSPILQGMVRLTIRVDFDDGSGLGPGKVQLLELVAKTGSIRKAAVELGMSYRKAWLLLQALKETFGEPLVETASGGRSGGGTSLTAAGVQVVTRYRNLERSAGKAAAADLRALTRKLGVTSSAGW